MARSTSCNFRDQKELILYSICLSVAFKNVSRKLNRRKWFTNKSPFLP
jgi:hypothetical protein